MDMAKMTHKHDADAAGMLYLKQLSSGKLAQKHRQQPN
jgi:hypothetical protein